MIRVLLFACGAVVFAMGVALRGRPRKDGHIRTWRFTATYTAAGAAAMIGSLVADQGG